MTPEVDAPRLDVWLAAQRNLTRHAARTLIDAGLVQVRGRTARAGQRINSHDGAEVVVLDPPQRAEPARSNVAAPELRIVYEDECLAVIDKPAGLVVHRGAGHPQGTLADALLQRGTTWSLLGGEDRPGIVHRLDRDTSGLLVVAKTEQAHRALAAQLRDRSLGRTYWTLVQGGFREETGSIEAPIGRDPRNRLRMAVVDGGREAITDFTVMERLGGATRLEVSLRTGRTHQIRVHCAYIRHPVIGDALYGHKDASLRRPALHATRLRLQHPVTQQAMVFDSQPPDELLALLQRLRDGAR